MEHILSQFPLDGLVQSCERYGSGHINITYLLVTDKGHRYIMQAVNPAVFANVPALMNNIASVTAHIMKKVNDPRRVLTLIYTHSGESFYATNGEYYRIYEFVEQSICMEKVTTDEEFYASAVGFGEFQNMLADFPAETLHETIDRFHDTPNRYRNLHEAIKSDPLGRLADVREEVAFALAHEEVGATLIKLRDAGILPLRVTHNDTKLNNVLLDGQTRQALCVIDLDTVMPGLVANDFGDSIRFGATTAAEDETNLDLVHFSLHLYEVFTNGFVKTCKDTITEKEVESLPMGAMLMTLECGIRFLTDYLVGDVYFRIHREKHNLDRCRTQFKLVSEMEQQWDQMMDIAKKALTE